MKRILFIDQYRNYGGGQKVLLQVMSCALAHGWKLSLLAPMGGDFQAQVQRHCGNQIELLPLPEMKLRPVRKKLSDALRFGFETLRLRRHLPPSESFDLIYVNGPRLFLAANMRFRSKAHAIAYHVHLDHSPTEKRLINWISKRKSTRAIVTVSPFVDSGLRTFSPGMRHVILVENGLTEEDSKRTYVSRFTERTALNVSVVGRISPEKGQNVIVDLAPRFPEAKFFMFGDEEFGNRSYADRLRSRSPSNVIWLGKRETWRDDLDHYGIQLAIVPSQCEEGFGLVAIESMANSLLTLVSPRGGLVDIARRTGALVFETQEELLQRLREISAMPLPQAEQLARDQHERTQREYSPAKFEQKIRPVLADGV